MLLYLVRHGDALASDIDPQRPLSSKGEADIRKIAKALKKARVEVSVIFHSGLKRAQQTAEIIAQALPSCRLEQKDSLGPDDSPGPVYEEIIKSAEDAMIVGHLPFLSRLSAKLLFNNESVDAVDFKKGAVMLLERQINGPCRVKWLITPKLA